VHASILIIDDNHASLGSLQPMLESLGYTVKATLTGIDGLFAIGSSPWDLVLLDLVLPDMSGFEILDNIRATRSMIELPVIMLTAVTGTREIVEALERGANDYVSKPYDFAVMKSRIQTQIALKKTEEALRLSEERYTLAAQATRDGLWDWRLDRDTFYVSSNWRSLLGIDPQTPDPVPDDWFDRIHPADLVFFRERLESLKEGKADRMELEYRIRHEDGRYRWMQVTGVVKRDRTGQAIRMTGSMSDVTHGKLYNSFSDLPNAVLMEDRIGQLLRQPAHGVKGSLCILFIDVDRFRFINQAYGTAVGDHVLLELIGRLRNSVRKNETLAHVGRDEFLILVENPGDAGEIDERVLEIAAEIGRPVIPPGMAEEILLTAAIGISLSGRNEHTPGELISDAESAMNLAKKGGINQYRFFQEEYAEQVRRHLGAEKDLVNAMKKGELVMYYQPQVRIADDTLMGFESLIRWNSPQKGLIMPDQLIPLAEENGMIHSLGEWIVETVCDQILAWQKQGLHPGRVAVNLSPLQFRDKDLGRALSSVLGRKGIDPSLIELEITETKAMENPLATIKIMNDLRDTGLTFSIDDFGTGYSSLSLLQRFPLSTLKIDRAFIAEMMGSDGARSIVEAIVVLAHSLGFFTIAEGVETPEQLGYLKRLGCGGYQGFLRSRAVSPESATELLRSRL
jgi:diguanylate cyclase (GGDEF)-like protein/PAS domain S-box-containing protein